jgi:hypothetical protein
VAEERPPKKKGRPQGPGVSRKKRSGYPAWMTPVLVFLAAIATTVLALIAAKSKYK